tara:strand:- start:102 stop:512 length:411 start_codon:yes stop_codon:yes gene_type:complete
MIYRNKTGIVSFKIIKEIDYLNEDITKEKYNDFTHLKNKTFNRIHIPEFTFKKNNESLSYTSDYVKGIQIHEHIKEKYKKIIYEDLVMRKDDYSFTGYGLENFIIENYTKRLYYIDLDDYRKSSIEERIKRFNKFW